LGPVLHPPPEPGFLSAGELPHPYNDHAREFCSIYQHPLTAVFNAERWYWEYRFSHRDVAEITLDVRDAIEEALTLVARRLFARSRRRKVSTAERLLRLNDIHAYNAPYDVVRSVLLRIVGEANRGITWLTPLCAPPPGTGRVSPFRAAAFMSAVWLVQHHPQHKLIWPHLVTLLLAGRWDPEHLLEQDSEPTLLVRKAVQDEAKRLAGRALDEAALIAFLQSWL
jgi:hypothetical protein